MTRNTAPSSGKTARQPTSSPITPPNTWPKITPMIVPDRKRASTVWRSS